MNNFFIVANADKDTDFELTRTVCDFLTKKGAVCTYQEKDNFSKYNYANPANVPSGTDCIIVLGGDGTLIQAARDLCTLNIPVFGVNLGNLGYLTEIDREQIFPALQLLLDDKIFIDNRILIEGKVIRDNEEIYSGLALNDIVLNRVGPLQVINFDLHVNGEFLISYPADGLIVATPTGSTAYNLSAGGPIVKPENDIMVVTPVCPHTLNKSSIILDGSDVLEIVLSKTKNGREERAVSFDGGKYFKVKSGDRIVITKSSGIARLVHTKKHNFLQILRNKMS